MGYMLKMNAGDATSQFEDFLSDLQDAGITYTSEPVTGGMAWNVQSPLNGDLGRVEMRGANDTTFLVIHPPDVPKIPVAESRSELRSFQDASNSWYTWQAQQKRVLVGLVRGWIDRQSTPSAPPDAPTSPTSKAGKRLEKMGDKLDEREIPLDVMSIEKFAGLLASQDSLECWHVGNEGELSQWHVKFVGNLDLGYITALPIGKVLQVKFYRMPSDVPYKDIVIKDARGVEWTNARDQPALGKMRLVPGRDDEWESENTAPSATPYIMIRVLDEILAKLKTEQPTLSTENIELHIEDIDSFARAKNIIPQEVKPLVPLNLLEDQVQTFFEQIIGENFHQEDFGGEMNDVVSSQVRVGERRLRAAFILKGRGTKGKLTIKGCGKNGDQIVRLVEAPVDLYVIQHVDEIDQRVVYDLKSKVELKNRKGEPCQMCIIDGTDTARILVAYDKIPGASKGD